MTIPSPADVPVVILCGGEGTRFREESQYRPKPLVEIGGWPIVCHIMRIYARQGFTRFVLCLGYKGVMIKEYFLNFETRQRDFALSLSGAGPRFLDQRPRHDWDISFVDTGPRTMTGGRVARVGHVIDAEHFMLTYGDGLADIDLNSLLRFHCAHGRLGTVTGVRSQSQFGELGVDGDQVRSFAEKPKITSLINAGFFVFRRGFLDYLSPDEDCVLEQTPLSRLASDGQLNVYRHDGFWRCVDTFKDYRALEDMWQSGAPPWGDAEWTS